VQSFLFDAIQSHEQQKQNDEHTLRKIRAASKTISVDFHDAVVDKFGDSMKCITWSKCIKVRTLPSGSGMVLFVLESKEKSLDCYSSN
jgi:hypothetical protein